MFVFFNDTGRTVSVHPATKSSCINVDMNDIKPLEERTFILPVGSYPWVKMWDYGGKDRGLSILVASKTE